jgi:hypothetical protein
MLFVMRCPYTSLVAAMLAWPSTSDTTCRGAPAEQDRLVGMAHGHSVGSFAAMPRAIRLARLKNFAGSAAPEAARGALTRTLLTGGRAAHLMVR